MCLRFVLLDGYVLLGRGESSSLNGLLRTSPFILEGVTPLVKRGSEK